MLGDDIRLLRKGLGYTRSEFARLVGVSDTAVTKWEHGYVKPSARMFVQIARVLGVSVEELYRLAGNPPVQAPEKPVEPENTSKVYYVKVFERLGVLLPDGSINDERLTALKALLDAFCSINKNLWVEERGDQ